jgi:hypothetical protein
MDSIGNLDNIWLLQTDSKIDFSIVTLSELNMMTISNPQPNLPESSIDDTDLEQQADTKLYDRPTPDSYDPHIIPAETAARKEREGENFKRLPKHPPGSESLDTTAGFTVDKEGLVDTPGDVPEEEQLKQFSS